MGKSCVYIYKWGIFHCHVWLPEGSPLIHRSIWTMITGVNLPGCLPIGWFPQKAGGTLNPWLFQYNLMILSQTFKTHLSKTCVGCVCVWKWSIPSNGKFFLRSIRFYTNFFLVFPAFSKPNGLCHPILGRHGGSRIWRHAAGKVLNGENWTLWCHQTCTEVSWQKIGGNLGENRLWMVDFPANHVWLPEGDLRKEGLTNNTYKFNLTGL